MQRQKFRASEKAIAIVAHPDDETIWMGGFILKHPQLDWTIFSLCRASDKDRAPKFRRVCKLYGARSIITDLEDKNIMSVKESIPKIKRIIKLELKNRKYEYLFTHGDNGEYGHLRHKGVNRAVRQLASERQLSVNKTLYFNYERVRNKKHKLKVKNDSDVVLKLTETELEKKKRIVANFYGYDFDGIDVSYCTNPEAFKVVHITHNIE